MPDLLHHQLRRGADERELAEVEVEHVRRGVEHAQRAVQRERVGVERRLEAQREHRLEDVAGADVLLGRLDHLLEARLRDPALEAPLLRAAEVGDRVLRQRPLERLDHRLDREHRLRVGRVRLAADVRERDDRDLVRVAVEREQRVGEHEAGVRQVEVVLEPRRQPLEPAHRVVGEEADGAARERRQPLVGDHAVARQLVLEQRERVARVVAVPLAVAQELGPPALGAEDRARPRAEEGVAPGAAAALDALEQEAVGAAAELEERRDRRLEVGHDLRGDRDEVPLPALLPEDFLRRLEHRSSLSPAPALLPPSRRGRGDFTSIPGLRRRKHDSHGIGLAPGLPVAADVAVWCSSRSP